MISDVPGYMVVGQDVAVLFHIDEDIFNSTNGSQLSSVIASVDL